MSFDELEKEIPNEALEMIIFLDVLLEKYNLDYEGIHIKKENEEYLLEVDNANSTILL